jgi:pimeloyl-ACP methyl ester carboxylesterase
MEAEPASARTSSNPEGRSVRNVVLVHGAYADGSSWLDVIEYLQRADDVAHTRYVLGLQDGPTILVAHSFAGTVITEVGIDPSVAGLVYIAARAPDVDEDHAALAKTFPTAPANAGLVFHDRFGALTEEAFLNDFANGVDPVRARALYAVQGRVSDTLFNDRTTEAAWRSKPSWYAVSRLDRTISPELQHFLAQRTHATTVEIDSGHLSMVTHAQQISQLILDAARTASDGNATRGT